MNTEERFEQLLELKDAEITRLQEELEKANDRREKDWEWAAHIDLEDEHFPQLPVPRLEMEWKKDGETWQSCTCFYGLIYRHTIGHLVYVPLGQTRTNSGANESPKTEFRSTNIRIPFRDGVHIANESAQLNLPAFVICEEKIDRISLKDGKIHQEEFRP